MKDFFEHGSVILGYAIIVAFHFCYLLWQENRRLTKENTQLRNYNKHLLEKQCNTHQN